ncbi:flagellar export chaperone FliS [Coralloluteibacterium stylophorae]|uniref:Flagellar secretion chaperone FliS n=1 Tax=Coralloluteibacterium stylophorae TaxID=1776034 RepID=A0A8J7VU38_9GAMM|nr:flagellar export chaperone FliS [Coralloluteibacterium stylophorae]MBS7457207.1 flagellar export chaperone FliS [Coralloluteibacterium stylophorae]
MYANAAAQYRQTGVSSKVLEADPHQLIALLLAGARERIQRAEALIARGDTARKAQAISETANIIAGLAGSLDHARGGEIAAGLQSLYDYMQQRLLEANVGNDAGKLREVGGLLADIENAWAAIPDNLATARTGT